MNHRIAGAALHSLLLASIVACASRPDRTGPNASAGGAGGLAAGNGGAGNTAGLATGGGASGVGGSAGTAGGGGSAGAQLGDDAPIGPPPDFGPNVLIFDPSMPAAQIQAEIDAVLAQQKGYEAGEFSSNRFAYFFKPGEYQLDVGVSYYMQVLGLGQLPDDVTITGAVRSLPDYVDNGALLNFWRSVENLAVVPTMDDNVLTWAASQGTSFRRVHVRGPLQLNYQNGWSSGGFIADSKIDAHVYSGTQQQYLTRNTEFAQWQDGPYNHYALVFVGDTSPPAENWPTVSYSVVEQAPVLREKPYLHIDADGNYFVRAPALETNRKGHSWAAGSVPGGRSITTGHFYVAKPESDTAATLNAALAQGKHLLLTPGIYHLDVALEVERENTIVMGLGLATLVPDQGNAVIEVADVDGVRISSLLLEAGPQNSETLLQLGEQESSLSHAQNPSSLHDICCRVGGAGAGKTTSCVTINSNDTIAENLWLWRADHGDGVGWTVNPGKNGLIVNGDDVTIYGLLVEHFQEYQTLWNGNGGQLFFYQSEMPYDPPNQDAWRRGTVNGYPSYKVADGVTDHRALGLGVYSVFYTDGVSAENAIEAPAVPGVQLRHMATATFNGHSDVQIAHIFNGAGDYVSTSHTPSFFPE